MVINNGAGSLSERCIVLARARGTDRHTKINIIDLPVSNLITRGGAMLTSVGESPAT